MHGVANIQLFFCAYFRTLFWKKESKFFTSVNEHIEQGAIEKEEDVGKELGYHLINLIRRSLDQFLKYFHFYSAVAYKVVHTLSSTYLSVHV